VGREKKLYTPVFANQSRFGGAQVELRFSHSGKGHEFASRLDVEVGEVCSPVFVTHYPSFVFDEFGGGRHPSGDRVAAPVDSSSGLLEGHFFNDFLFGFIVSEVFFILFACCGKRKRITTGSGGAPPVISHRAIFFFFMFEGKKNIFFPERGVGERKGSFLRSFFFPQSSGLNLIPGFNFFLPLPQGSF